jgi:Ribosomal protein L9, N-terminal domain
MAKRVQLVLNQDVRKLGKNGDLVEVAPGYARNYLIPQKIAANVTPGLLKQAEKRREIERLRLLALKEVALTQQPSIKLVNSRSPSKLVKTSPFLVLSPPQKLQKSSKALPHKKSTNATSLCQMYPKSVLTKLNSSFTLKLLLLSRSKSSLSKFSVDRLNQAAPSSLFLYLGKFCLVQ